jgi:2,3-diaminopropionate biosynthesis protein SbnA
MAVVSVPHAFHQEDLYVDLRNVFEQSLYLKCEGFNLAGSIKLKPAIEMVEAAERDGELFPGSILVESSSGNLGVALSMIAASKSYRFLCVTDSRCNTATRRLMEALGADVHTITMPSRNGGFLGARVDFIRALCAADDRYVWLNQYANPNNWRAHYNTTAPAIVREFPQLDVLFVGAGTTGTLMGCARYLRDWHPHVRVVAVDAVGSVAFGGPPRRRMIPGLGTSVRPSLLDDSVVPLSAGATETIRVLGGTRAVGLAQPSLAHLPEARAITGLRGDVLYARRGIGRIAVVIAARLDRRFHVVDRALECDVESER